MCTEFKSEQYDCYGCGWEKKGKAEKLPGDALGVLHNAVEAETSVLMLIG